MSNNLHPDVLLIIRNDYIRRIKDGENLSPEELEDLLKIQENALLDYLKVVDNSAALAKQLLEEIRSDYQIMAEFLEDRGLSQEYELFYTKFKKDVSQEDSGIDEKNNRH
ncbi:hypothetical protein [Paenibacillus woosongensis]|uniref:Uncharacterized protein n=1 Tax=Paenibacillus woosongensis TaxID=307580 RepID=A0A7X3CM07_9BACL|nr:hypothetical protein [Paenibacillus woosongensis]MUG43440.1 hypothetical protein [Paenibacillus woosongensis]